MINHMVLDRSPSLDRVFHALAHPARRAILRRLTESERNLSELAAPMRMSFPAASKHVRVLERAKLVKRRVAGRSHMCRLNAAPLRQVAEWTERYRRHWEAQFRELDALLDEMKQLTPPGPPGPTGSPASSASRASAPSATPAPFPPLPANPARGAEGKSSRL